ncbi:S41 family peptidase [Chitinophaga qingshengii]|uniref:Tail specific protease domain-containing protein n=1 Tax=Chitinophaga qingshengii TaxID=1569794 RepID=A0ABR7TRT2_9BACT|nr:S41 family peptidase [Chitinophaga qingshengii]MBC9933200.1 hypothetical protein [Chitinophaga qingshengii]
MRWIHLFLTDLVSVSGSRMSDVIVDLRYNAGGNLTELDRLANLLTPFGAEGKVMRKEQYNLLVKSGKTSLLLKQPIPGADGLPIYYNGKAITCGEVDYTEEKNTVYFNKVGGDKWLNL